MLRKSIEKIESHREKEQHLYDMSAKNVRRFASSLINALIHGIKDILNSVIYEKV